jgi:hypothetical protein
MNKPEVNAAVPAQEQINPLPLGVDVFYQSSWIKPYGSVTFMHDRRTNLDGTSRLRDCGPFFAVAQTNNGELFLARRCNSADELERLVFAGITPKPCGFDSPKKYFTSIGNYFADRPK